MIIHLFIPGLLRAYAPSVAHLPKPVAPALRRLLGQATATTTHLPLDALLFESFRPQPAWEMTADLPVAPLTRLAEGAALDEVLPYYWLRADPVYLHADFRQVLLFDANQLQIQADEAAQLVAACNAQMADADSVLEAAHPCRWYVRLPASASPAIYTWPLSEVVGYDITEHLPAGVDYPRWHRWLTEVQMVLHAHPCNQARVARGLQPINGLWLWGGGRLPEIAHPPGDGLYAVDPLVRGLARRADMTIHPLPATLEECWESAQVLDEKDIFVILETTRSDRRLADPETWLNHVEQLEQDWFIPLLQRLKKHHFTAVVIYPDDNRCYRITPRHLWQFWRSAYQWS